MKLMLLGGYGAVGYETAKILLRSTDAEIIIAGRNLEKARSAAARLIKETHNPRASGLSIDAFDYSQVVTAFKTVDWIIICIPLTGLDSQLAQAAYEAGVHYLDINANPKKQIYLQRMAPSIKQKGLTFISEAGCAPGLPSLLVLYAHEQLGALNTVTLGGIFRDAKISYGSAYDMLIHLGEKHRICKNGSWSKAVLSDGRQIDFGQKYGKHHCYPFELLELIQLPLPEIGIKNLGLYVAGVNPVVDMLILIWMITRLYKYNVGLRLGTKLAMWAERFTRPPFCTLVQVDATTQRNRRLFIQVDHEDAYIATAIPLAACIIQMLETDLLTKNGVHLMGHFLKAEPFFENIKRLGMKITIEKASTQ